MAKSITDQPPKQIFLLYIGKKSLHDGQEFPQFSHEVGETVQALIDHLKKKYIFSESDLIKDENDHFPYFTDGGFKYTAANSNWLYTFTCHPKALLK